MKLSKIASAVHRAVEITLITALALRPIVRGRRHHLDREVIVSLTSHPPRFTTLHLSLRTLLNQSVRPDRIILWVAEEDVGQVPDKVRALNGVEIRPSNDYRSYTKIIPALDAFPDAYIVTADDDLYYPRRWLDRLLNGVDPTATTVVANRCYRFSVRDGQVAPALEWVVPVGASDLGAQEPSRDLFVATGYGAVFPPGSLHPNVIRPDLFLRLAPFCDDTWLTWMLHLAGTRMKTTGIKPNARVWMGAYGTSLWLQNGAGRMDQHIKAMSEYFGPLHRLKAPHEMN